MRWLRFLVAVLVVLLLLEGFARVLEPRLPAPVRWSHPFVQAKFDQLEQVQDDGGADVLVVGSSLVNANVDAIALGDALGVRAYNVGLPSSNIPLWNAYLQDVALERTCPGVVVFGVGLRDSNDRLPGYAGYVPRFRESLGYRELSGELGWLERVQVEAESLSAFIRIRSRLREPANVASWLLYGRARGWTDTNLDAGGRYLNFADNSFPADPTALVAGLADTMENYRVGGRQFAALRGAIGAVRAAGAHPVIVLMPGVESSLVDALPNGQEDLDAFHTRLTQLARQRNVPLLDPQELDDRPELYADLYHMNEAGAFELTKLLAEWLIDLDLPLSAGCTS